MVLQEILLLKTAEGTANFIVKEFKNSMTSNILGKLSSLINIKNLNKVKKKLDPRLYNGAILIGLNSPVVKSHGSTDYIGFSHSLNVCIKIVKNNLIQKIKDNILNENKFNQKRYCKFYLYANWFFKKNFRCNFRRYLKYYN